MQGKIYHFKYEGVMENNLDEVKEGDTMSQKLARYGKGVSKGKYYKSKFPVLRELTLGEIIETVVSNKGSGCRSDDFMVEVRELIKLRSKEAENLVNNIMDQLIREIREYE